MATKAELKAKLDALGIEYKARASHDTLVGLLPVAEAPVVEETPVVEATAAIDPDVDVAPPAEPDTTNIQTGEVIIITLGERFIDGEYKGRTCKVFRDGAISTDPIFTAQSYPDVLTSLQSWLKEEGKSWK